MEKGMRKDKNVFSVGVVILRLNAVLKMPNVIIVIIGIVGHISQKCLKSKEKNIKKNFQNSTQLLEKVTVVNKNEDFDDLYHIYRNSNENLDLP